MVEERSSREKEVRTACAFSKEAEASKPAATGKLYRVQVGAYSVKANAEAQLAKVKAAGFTDAFIV